MSNARPRVLFYCHNVTGLGHISRSLCIARALGRRAEPMILTGCRFLDRLDIPDGVGVERHPGLVALGSGRLEPAPGEPADAVERRAERIVEICSARRPAAVVVDQRPMGLGGELMPVLHRAGEEGWATRFIWGIPYLERAGAVVPRPRNPRIVAALAHYDSAMVYDDESLDVAHAYGEYGLPDDVVHLGLVTGPLPALDPPERIVVLCGGGTGGAELFELSLAALQRAGLAAQPLRLVVGPFGDVDRTAALLDSAGFSDAEVWAAGSVEDATRDAELVVARCGYNTAAALVGSPLPVVFVPLHKREDEQLRRAARFAALDGVWEVDDQADDAAATLAAAVSAARQRGRAPRSVPFPLDGADRAADWIMSRSGGGA